MMLNQDGPKQPMQERFSGFWHSIRAEGNDEREFFRLDILYSDPRRFYHTFRHIESCLDEFEDVRSLSNRPYIVEFAIWYHDAVYNTRAKDNEERSAWLAYNIARSAHLDFASRARELILKTKHNTSPRTIDGKILVDLELSILGKSPEKFDEYERNIRKEYSWATDENFRKARSTILQFFLGKEHIYKTDYFRERYEDQARMNIRRSIADLKSRS